MVAYRAELTRVVSKAVIMLRSVLTAAVCITTLLAPLACKGGGGHRSEGPTITSSTLPESLVPTQLSGSAYPQGEELLGMYQAEIDPISLAGRVTPVATRFAAKQGDLFHVEGGAYVGMLDVPGDAIDMSKFLEIQGIALDENGDLQLTFEHQHPFRSPKRDFAGGDGNASNRADLGYTGRLVFFMDLLADEKTEEAMYRHTLVPAPPPDTDLDPDYDDVLRNGTVLELR